LADFISRRKYEKGEEINGESVKLCIWSKYDLIFGGGSVGEEVVGRSKDCLLKDITSGFG
jgi:hypothetical protein